MKGNNTSNLIKQATNRLNDLGREIFKNYQYLESKTSKFTDDSNYKKEINFFLNNIRNETPKKIKYLCTILEKPENMNQKLDFLCFIVDYQTDDVLKLGNCKYILKRFRSELSEISQSY